MEKCYQFTFSNRNVLLSIDSLEHSTEIQLRSRMPYVKLWHMQHCVYREISSLAGDKELVILCPSFLF